jgi:hypothetical protein
MNLWPWFSETIIVPDTIHIVCKRLELSIRDGSEGPRTDNPKEDKHIKFNGRIEGDAFTLSPRIKHAESFIPIVNGKLEPAGATTLLMLNYRCFFSTIAFLTFWTTMCLLASFYFFLSLKEPLTGFLILSVGIAQYLLSMVFFNRQIAKTRNLIHQVLFNP